MCQYCYCRLSKKSIPVLYNCPKMSSDWIAVHSLVVPRFIEWLWYSDCDLQSINSQPVQRGRMYEKQDYGKAFKKW